MGAVYEGENVRIHRTVAIKVLHAGVAENQDAVQRFEREAQAAGRIGSEHIVEVLDLGNLPNGDRFMVMEFMDGDSMSARIHKRGRLTPHEVYPIARQILDGLSAAHGAGIIHRDLKPDNVYLLKSRGGRADFVKLLDFGISKFSAMSGESGFSMTRTGAVMGTPYYMSPEQAKGAKSMDHRADLYAVGVILYEAITGQVPFSADTFNELLFKIVLETPPPIEQLIPDSDPAFVAIINKAMARDPGVRYQTSRDFQEALDQWASGHGIAALPAAAQPNVRATPGGGSAPPPQIAPSTPARTMGTPGTWANTGVAPVAGDPKKNNTMILASIAAGVLLLGGGTVAALSMRGGGEAQAPPTASATAQAAGPSLDDIKAAAAEAAKNATAQAQKQAEEEIRKAEQRAREAEERAKQFQSAQAQEEAKVERERVEKLRASAPRAAAPKATQPKPASSPAATAAPTSTGRKIRTEL